MTIKNRQKILSFFIESVSRKDEHRGGPSKVVKVVKVVKVAKKFKPPKVLGV